MAHNGSETEDETHPTARQTRPRKQRPSRARGLRGITGCVTCRSRRVKCDEQRPRCGQCKKSDRDCAFGVPKPPRRRKLTATDSPHNESSLVHEKVAHESGMHREDSALRISGHVTGTATTTFARTQAIQDQDDTEIEAADIPTAHSPSFQTTRLTGPIIGFGYNSASELGCSPSAPLYDNNASAVDWFDLLAQDAINNLQRVGSSEGVVSWNFDENSLSRRQSPGPALPESDLPAVETTNINTINHHPPAAIVTPWNSKPRIQIDANESLYLYYYTTVVGPILDLLDPARHFSDTVTHLAMHNTGLLKSIIAVAARHMALQGFDHLADVGQCPVRLNGEETALTTRHVATQNYYETLQYVSQTMMYATYQESPEILGTAILLSAYEMFDSDNVASAGNWERHLRGSFWIQRTQENNGEMAEGLRRATWWAWLRQDIWAAFREGRRTMTFFRARRKPEELTTDELVNRVFLIAARCVNYHADSNTQSDVLKRLQKGEELLKELEHWHSVLPSSFKPIATGVASTAVAAAKRDSLSTLSVIDSTASLNSLDSVFPPMWIHPPAHAAAIQMFHVCRILIVLNQPSSGGRSEYVKRQRVLQGSVMSICGISNTRQGKDLPSALVNAQALYIAGLCVEGAENRAALLQILTETLEITKFPPRTLADDLVKLWD